MARGVGGLATDKAFVLGELSRVRRPAVTREARRGRHDGEPEVSGHGYGDHVLVDYLAELDARVAAFRNDVDRRVAHDEVELNVRILREEAGDERLAGQRLRGARGVDAQRAGRLVSELAHRDDGGAHLVQRGPHRRVGLLPGLGGVNAPRGSPNERHAEPLLESAERLAHRRVAHPRRWPAARNPLASATATKIAIPSSSSVIGRNADQRGR